MPQNRKISKQLQKKQLPDSPTEVVKDVLYNRKKLKTINKEALEMEKVMPFLNENLSEGNNKIAFFLLKTEARRNDSKYLLGKWNYSLIMQQN